MAQGRCLIPIVYKLPPNPIACLNNYLDADLLVYSLLFVLDLLLKLLELGAVGCCSIRLQHLDVPVACLAGVLAWRGIPAASYSSVRGVIFFSSTSSSAKFFWYFSQLLPVALGMASGSS